ncbi:5-(carboxyamino)imidazole ribonucleotide mutase [Candidatus Izemoplasma sp. B36]|uniref:5-(carboxyamino)imidazole ribonucleotide mutase n=1 Tax=Candidatus Izemoplasma sp. B36 TaxID=3242468 RepID=UPI003556BB5F
MKKVSVIMGSTSDWEVMKKACLILEEFGVSYTRDAISAHRTPDKLDEIIFNAEKHGCKVIIAGAGGAAHLPGVIASKTILPIIGVPIMSKLSGLDSLLSIVQMPSGIPVATMAIDGAKNAALYAISILALEDEDINKKLIAYRKSQAQKVIDNNKLVI